MQTETKEGTLNTALLALSVFDTRSKLRARYIQTFLVVSNKKESEAKQETRVLNDNQITFFDQNV